jgi:dTDP-4-dehydrorhamnose 3,5-epimerase
MVRPAQGKSLTVASLDIPDVKLVIPQRHADARGFFTETFNRHALADAGIDFAPVQDNYSLSKAKGTVRGLHFQLPPFAQAKIVSVIRGSVFDVALDLRRGSPTQGRHVSAVLTAEGGEQIYLPVGFAHGFCTLEPDTAVMYKVDAYYSAAHDRGVLWCDSDLAIAWPAVADPALLSSKDRTLPCLSDIELPFEYDGAVGGTSASVGQRRT